MASTHLFALKRKHETIQARIDEEYKHSSRDHLAVRSLKEEKLHLKEQIERIEGRE